MSDTPSKPIIVSPSATAGSAHIISARRTLELEIVGLQALEASLEGPFSACIETLAGIKGRVIITGMGKSGHVGHKIAATMASLGTPTQFVHPGEASHGDMGMITPDDAVLALSWSGGASELTDIILYTKRFGIPLISMTSNADSALGQAADILLELPKAKEACPNGLAPTTSTTMQMALGDAIAIALLEKRGFSAEDYKVFHPGGKLGAMLAHVGELMHKGNELPLAPADMLMSEALPRMTEKSLGALGIVDDENKLLGVITDGDLRRHMSSDFLSKTAGEVMTKDPKTIPPTLLAAEALQLLNSTGITSFFVVADNQPVGFIHMHDLLRAGIA